MIAPADVRRRSPRMTLPFKATVEQIDGDVLVVNVAGELDVATVPELERVLGEVAESDSRSLIVDLSDCSFIDSSGLGALVSARERTLRAEGGSFGVCCPDAQVRRLLEITGLDTAMGVVASREEALEALQAADV
jgi:anti-sigma B factor antagonist